MKKYLILCFIFVFALSVNAQDKDSKQDCKTDSCRTVVKYAPQKGDFTTAMVFGRGAYLTGGLVVPSSNSDVTGEGPYANDVSANDNSITNMVGAEVKYYTSNKFAITFTGGAILSNTPQRLGVPGVPGVLVGNDAIVAVEKANIHFSLGGQWLLKTKNNRMFPYIGFALPFDYARSSEFDPTPLVDEGIRHAEITSYGVTAVAGVDYYVVKDVFFGFDIKPISYAYSISTKSPGSGLIASEADTDTVSFFAQFSFKIGFKF